MKKIDFKKLAIKGIAVGAILATQTGEAASPNQRGNDNQTYYSGEKCGKDTCAGKTGPVQGPNKTNTPRPTQPSYPENYSSNSFYQKNSGSNNTALNDDVKPTINNGLRSNNGFQKNTSAAKPATSNIKYGATGGTGPQNTYPRPTTQDASKLKNLSGKKVVPSRAQTALNDSPGRMNDASGRTNDTMNRMNDTWGNRNDRINPESSRIDSNNRNIPNQSTYAKPRSGQIDPRGAAYQNSNNRYYRSAADYNEATELNMDQDAIDAMDMNSADLPPTINAQINTTSGRNAPRPAYGSYQQNRPQGKLSYLKKNNYGNPVAMNDDDSDHDENSSQAYDDEDDMDEDNVSNRPNRNNNNNGNKNTNSDPSADLRFRQNGGASAPRPIYPASAKPAAQKDSYSRNYNNNNNRNNNRNQTAMNDEAPTPGNPQMSGNYDQQDDNSCHGQSGCGGKKPNQDGVKNNNHQMNGRNYNGNANGNMNGRNYNGNSNGNMNGRNGNMNGRNGSYNDNNMRNNSY